jgi:microcystin-dependent protein
VDSGRLNGTPVLGATGGEEFHTLSAGEMPSHSHGIAGAAGSSGALGGFFAGLGTGQLSQAVGGGAAHNNMPPYVIINYIIKC